MSGQIIHDNKSEHAPFIENEDEGDDHKYIQQQQKVSNHYDNKDDHDQNGIGHRNGLHSRSKSEPQSQKADNKVSQNQSKSDSKNRSRSKTKRRSTSRSLNNRKKRSSRKHKGRSKSADGQTTNHRSSSHSSSKNSKKYRKKRRNRSVKRSRSNSRSKSLEYVSPSRNTKQTWWQSLKPRPVVQESRKIWDGFQWVVQNPANDIYTGIISQARKDRRLYIGNLPSGVPPEQLRDFMEKVLRGCIQIPDDVEKVVSAAWIGPTGTFGFIEVATVEIAAIALGLGRIEFNGSMLRISRPNDYQEQANLGFLAGVIGKTA